MQHGFKSFAPFGQLLHDLRAAQPNLNYAPYIFCGRHALAEARKMLAGGLICMALPPNTQAINFRWSVNDLPLILFDTGEMVKQDLEDIAAALLDQGARQVCIYYADPPHVEIYNK